MSKQDIVKLRVWSLPVTRDKALKLFDLLEAEIRPIEAKDHLFAILGHEGLFQQLDAAGPNEDVRPRIRRCLKEMLWNSPPCFRSAWQIDARRICEAVAYPERYAVVS